MNVAFELQSFVEDFRNKRNERIQECFTITTSYFLRIELNHPRIQQLVPRPYFRIAIGRERGRPGLLAALVTPFVSGHHCFLP